MARLNGKTGHQKQKIFDDVTTRAKAECEFSDRLYEILLAYQNRYHDSKRKPLRQAEKIGDLSLELSRLYNQIWTVVIDLDGKARSKKKQKQMEVIA